MREGRGKSKRERERERFVNYTSSSVCSKLFVLLFVLNFDWLWAVQKKSAGYRRPKGGQGLPTDAPRATQDRPQRPQDHPKTTHRGP